MIDRGTFEYLFKFCLSLIIFLDKISLWFHYMLMYSKKEI